MRLSSAGGPAFFLMTVGTAVSCGGPKPPLAPAPDVESAQNVPAPGHPAGKTYRLVPTGQPLADGTGAGIVLGGDRILVRPNGDVEIASMRNSEGLLGGLAVPAR